METKKKRIRSPNFPIIDLGKSLGMIRKIYDSYKRYPVALEVVGKTISVSAGSYLAQHISAFLQYGLVEAEGEKKERKIKVSDLGFKIIMDERENSVDREKLIKEAALNPIMFRKLHEDYPTGLPENAAIEYELKVKHSFNPNSVSDFINVFRTTIEFAKVYNSGKMVNVNNKTKEPEMDTIDNVTIGDTQKPDVPPPVDPNIGDLYNSNSIIGESFPITLKDKKKAILSFSSLPIKRADIELIKKYLDLMADNWSVAESTDDEK